MSIIIKINNMDWNQPITATHLTFWTAEKKLVFPERSVRVNVVLFSCNLIGQLCLSGPGYSSRTVSELIVNLIILT